MKREVAMTGEITLRGRVLPVGGIKEKVLAAHRAGFTTVIIPKKNDKDLVDVPKSAKRDLKIILVERMEEVIDAAMSPAPLIKLKRTPLKITGRPVARA